MTKNRVIRVPEADWVNYGAICAAEESDRSEDLRAHIEKRIKTWRRQHPGVTLPGDEPAGE